MRRINIKIALKTESYRAALDQQYSRNLRYFNRLGWTFCRVRHQAATRNGRDHPHCLRHTSIHFSLCSESYFKIGMISKAREVRLRPKIRKVLEARCRAPSTPQGDLKRADSVLAAEGRRAR